MVLLRIGLSLVIWLICVSKIAGSEYRHNSDVAPYVERRDIHFSPLPCNKYSCRNIESGLKRKFTARKGPEISSIYEHVRPPEFVNRINITRNQPVSRNGFSNDDTQVNVLPNFVTTRRKASKCNVPKIQTYVRNALDTFLSPKYDNTENLLVITPKIVESEEPCTNDRRYNNELIHSEKRRQNTNEFNEIKEPNLFSFDKIPLIDTKSGPKNPWKYKNFKRTYEANTSNSSSTIKPLLRNREEFTPFSQSNYYLPKKHVIAPFNSLLIDKQTKELPAQNEDDIYKLPLIDDLNIFDDKQIGVDNPDISKVQSWATISQKDKNSIKAFASASSTLSKVKIDKIPSGSQPETYKLTAFNIFKETKTDNSKEAFIEEIKNQMSAYIKQLASDNSKKILPEYNMFNPKPTSRPEKNINQRPFQNLNQRPNQSPNQIQNLNLNQRPNIGPHLVTNLGPNPNQVPSLGSNLGPYQRPNLGLNQRPYQRPYREPNQSPIQKPRQQIYPLNKAREKLPFYERYQPARISNKYSGNRGPSHQQKSEPNQKKSTSYRSKLPLRHPNTLRYPAPRNPIMGMNYYDQYTLGKSLLEKKYQNFIQNERIRNFDEHHKSHQNIYSPSANRYQAKYFNPYDLLYRYFLPEHDRFSALQNRISHMPNIPYKAEPRPPMPTERYPRQMTSGLRFSDPNPYPKSYQSHFPYLGSGTGPKNIDSKEQIHTEPYKPKPSMSYKPNLLYSSYKSSPSYFEIEDYPQGGAPNYGLDYNFEPGYDYNLDYTDSRNTPNIKKNNLYSSEITPKYKTKSLFSNYNAQKTHKFQPNKQYQKPLPPSYNKGFSSAVNYNQQYQASYVRPKDAPYYPYSSQGHKIKSPTHNSMMQKHNNYKSKIPYAGFAPRDEFSSRYSRPKSLSKYEPIRDYSLSKHKQSFSLQNDGIHHVKKYAIRAEPKDVPNDNLSYEYYYYDEEPSVVNASQNYTTQYLESNEHNTTNVKPGDTVEYYTNVDNKSGNYSNNEYNNTKLRINSSPKLNTNPSIPDYEPSQYYDSSNTGLNSGLEPKSYYNLPSADYDKAEFSGTPDYYSAQDFNSPNLNPIDTQDYYGSQDYYLPNSKLNNIPDNYGDLYPSPGVVDTPDYNPNYYDLLYSERAEVPEDNMSQDNVSSILGSSSSPYYNESLPGLKPESFAETLDRPDKKPLNILLGSESSPGQVINFPILKPNATSDYINGYELGTSVKPDYAKNNLYLHKPSLGDKYKLPLPSNIKPSPIEIKNKRPRTDKLLPQSPKYSLPDYYSYDDYDTKSSLSQTQSSTTHKNSTHEHNIFCLGDKQHTNLKHEYYSPDYELSNLQYQSPNSKYSTFQEPGDNFKYNMEYENNFEPSNKNYLGPNMQYYSPNYYDYSMYSYLPYNQPNYGYNSLYLGFNNGPGINPKQDSLESSQSRYVMGEQNALSQTKSSNDYRHDIYSIKMKNRPYYNPSQDYNLPYSESNKISNNNSINSYNNINFALSGKSQYSPSDDLNSLSSKSVYKPAFSTSYSSNSPYLGPNETSKFSSSYDYDSRYAALGSASDALNYSPSNDYNYLNLSPNSKLQDNNYISLLFKPKNQFDNNLNHDDLISGNVKSDYYNPGNLNNSPYSTLQNQLQNKFPYLGPSNPNDAKAINDYNGLYSESNSKSRYNPSHAYNSFLQEPKKNSYKPGYDNNLPFDKSNSNPWYGYNAQFIEPTRSTDYDVKHDYKTSLLGSIMGPRPDNNLGPYSTPHCDQDNYRSSLENFNSPSVFSKIANVIPKLNDILFSLQKETSSQGIISSALDKKLVKKHLFNNPIGKVEMPTLCDENTNKIIIMLLCPSFQI